MSESVYADFGVKNATFGSIESLNEHQISMLQKDVAVRDGDDSITFKDLESAQEEEAAGQEVETEGQKPEEGTEGGGDDANPLQDFVELGDTPVELSETIDNLNDNESAFDDMVQSAISAGKVTAEDMNAIKAEYAKGGKLTEASYAKLQEAGYTERFVNSFIRGQEAMAEQYAAGVVRFAGGPDQFNRILGHLESTDKSTRDALEAAIIRKDLATTKAILNLAGRTLGKTRGVPAARTVTTTGKPVIAVAEPSKTEGFENKAAMVSAMSDKRYLRDSAYTNEVRAKVAASRF